MPATLRITLQASSYEGAISLLDQVKSCLFHCFREDAGEDYHFTIDGDLEGKKDELETGKEHYLFPFTITGEITVLGTYQEAQDEAYEFLKGLRPKRPNNKMMSCHIENVRFFKVDLQDQEEKKEAVV
ncbi:hypothetical protein [Reticulibacter mediterranei]|nr:hypothetical protein [Reticulibacter mediterranei]